MGDYLFFGGLAGMGVSALAVLVLIPVFRAQRKKKLKKIEQGEE